jgi:hypothetical protein
MYLALLILLDFQNPVVKLITEVTYAWVACCCKTCGSNFLWLMHLILELNVSIEYNHLEIFHVGYNKLLLG